MIKMNLRTAYAVLVAASCIGTLGCEASGPKRIDAATSSMRETRAMLDRGSEQVASVLTAARAVESAPDRTRAFEDLSKAIDRLESDAKKAQSAWASLTSRTDEHVKAWEAESAALSSDSSKQVAAGRREAFKGRMAAFQADLTAVKSSYGELMTKLSDIRILLANDLTAEGVEVARPFIAEAEKSATRLQANIAKLSAELEVEINRSATSAPKPAKG